MSLSEHRLVRFLSAFPPSLRKSIKWIHCIERDRFPYLSTRVASSSLLARATVKLDMYTRQDLMRILGISYRQLRTQLDALAQVDGLLAGQVVRGTKGRLEYSSAVLQMLKDLTQFAQLARREGKDLKQAAQQLAAKMQEQKLAQVVQNDGKHRNLEDNVKLLKARLRDKDELIQELREEVSFLRRRVEELAPLALPKPRPRLFAWLWPEKKRSAAKEYRRVAE